ncbi:MAG: hypothetical protein K6B44_09720 [Lachnospiraceae bacterium]|nr:hypothetical protein [Lachnospiraceae bacterium]
MIGGISGVAGSIGPLIPYNPYYGNTRFSSAPETEEAKGDGTAQKGIDDPVAKLSGRKECETCKNRRYVDGSDENVSFKSAARINPAAVEARVRGHEQEHVANAYDKAEQQGGKVLRASVTIKYAICPECGRQYVAGGETRTAIKTPKDTKNPYNKNAASYGQEAFKGNNMDTAV